MKRKTVWWWILGLGLLVYLYPFYCLLLYHTLGWDFGRLYTFGLELKDFMTVWIALGGVVAVVGGIIQTQRRITLQETQSNKQDEQFRAQTELQMRQQRDARFASGVELLGNPHESTRIGGAYNLYFLARDFEELRPAVCEILCAHLRSIAHKDKFPDKEHPANYPKNEVQSIIDLLFRKHETDESGEEVSIFLNEPKNLAEIFLSGIDFIGEIEMFVLLLNKINFRGTVLVEVTFGAATLTEVNFEEATLTKVNFYRSNLTEIGYSADFLITTLTGVGFSGATLIDVGFWAAILIEVDFGHVTLTQVGFEEATLTGVGFSGATLTEVTFREASLTEVGFSTYCFITTLIRVDFSGAKLTEGTVRFEDTRLEGYSYEEITKKGRSLELTSQKEAEPAE
jgi:uncharacterized protein YjbI with pentapeptide repeats